IVQGIQATKPDARYETILDEITAIQTALDTATPGSLVVILPESVTRAIELIESRNAVQVTTPVTQSNGHLEPTRSQILSPSREAIPTSSRS
ncbi:MAG TPA: hypothetical protein VL134_11855, partial [Leptolyngbya sp.]|nr:hypothetical protein [Leptolyngbya sp.]